MKTYYLLQCPNGSFADLSLLIKIASFGVLDPEVCRYVSGTPRTSVYIHTHVCARTHARTHGVGISSRLS